MDIRIGTSGFSFEDWRGTFYPATVDKGKMLDFYAQHFPTVEINSTYYRIPHPAIMNNLVKKVPSGFDFLVKVPQSFTHRRTDLDDDIAKFLQAIEPMEATETLSGLLAQFPYSFRFSPDSLDYLAMLKNVLEPRPLFAEFRHESWVNRTMYDRLRAEGVGYVCVDEPELPHLIKPDLFTTVPTGYVRFHGRNAEKWWDGGPLRYDYKYSEEELQKWKEKIDKLAAKGQVQRMYLFFNNCHLGQAAANAFDMKRLLGL